MFNVTLSDKERCLKDAMIVNRGQPTPSLEGVFSVINSFVRAKIFVVDNIKSSVYAASRCFNRTWAPSSYT